MVKLHDRLLRGRKLVVTYANSVGARRYLGKDHTDRARHLFTICHYR